MRLIQILVPGGKREVVIETLEENGVDYTIVEETGREQVDAVIEFPLPTAAVEPILSDLRSVGIDENTYTVILEAETVISKRFEELADTYSDKDNAVDEDEEIAMGRITGGNRIAREELLTRATDLVASTPTYAVLTLLSAVIATAGMLLDSPATVVGSMVIAPLIGPSMAASIGTVLNDRSLFRRGVKMQLLGILVAIASATAFALVVRYLFLVPPSIEILEISEISERARPNVLVLAIALGAGVAGILSLMTGVSTALVGVMIAVALIPPAAAVGIGLAFGIPRLAIGAGVLVSVNILSINLSSLGALWFERYQPEQLFQIGQARSALIRRLSALVLVIVLMSAFLGGVTYDTYVAANVEDQLRQEVNAELEQTETPLELREMRVMRSGIVPPRETDRVVVRIAIDPSREVPALGDRLAEPIRGVAGPDVDIEIEYMLVERA